MSLPDQPTEKVEDQAEEKKRAKANQRKKRIKKELRKAGSTSKEVPELKTEPSDEPQKPRPEAGEKKKKSCNCKKSKCLKFYCECLSSGGFCGPDCGCVGCHNNLEHLEERETFLKKNPDYHRTN